DTNEEFSNESNKNSNTEVEQEYKGPLDLHIICELSKSGQSRFGYLLLKMTITLSTHKQLSKKILNKAITKFILKIEETAKKDKV
ncbi:4079_t:CDS:2, partial [Cetraspora pellucida]